KPRRPLVIQPILQPILNPIPRPPRPSRTFSRRQPVRRSPPIRRAKPREAFFLKLKDRSHLLIMVDPQQAIEKARNAISERVELPGMSLMEHLEELRKRIVHSAIYLGLGFAVAWYFRDRLVDFIQAPLKRDGKTLNMIHPMDGMNLNIHAALAAGAILACPFILYQVWLFIAPGLYQKEKRFV